MMGKRLPNWDLLRSLLMFLVIVVHAAGDLGEFGEMDLEIVIKRIALICNPLFFALSGYFAIRPSKRTLGNFYIHKLITLVLPMVLYSLILFPGYLYVIGQTDALLVRYFEFDTLLLTKSWWFIPTLIPCIIVAPFLNKGFEALTDRQLKVLGIIIGILALSAIVLGFIRWEADIYEWNAISLFCQVIQDLFPTSILMTSTQFFVFFLLGGIFSRVYPILTMKTKKALILVALLSWVFDVLWVCFEIPFNGESYFWVFITVGLLAVFAEMDIRSEGLSKIIIWTGKRSYSIYLVQFAVLIFLRGLIYTDSVFGDVALMGGFERIIIWIGYIVCAYLISLAVSSLIDTLLLSKIQNLLFRKENAR